MTGPWQVAPLRFRIDRDHDLVDRAQEAAAAACLAEVMPRWERLLWKALFLLVAPLFGFLTVFLVRAESPVWRVGCLCLMLGCLFGIFYRWPVRRAILRGHRRRMDRWGQRFGSIEVTLDHRRVRFDEGGIVTVLPLDRVERILRIDGGTVLVVGPAIGVVPDAALPEGVNSAALLERLRKATGLAP